MAGELSQEGEEGEYPVVFLSSKLTGPMLRYSILEKECWATIYCLKKVEHIIWGSKTHLYVDNNPLYFSMNSKPSSSKLTRWGLALAKYDIDIHCIAGNMNTVPDCLSRM